MKIHATYRVTSEPATEPVSLSSLKESLRVSSCDFDEELQRLLTTARRQVENDSRRKLVTQTVAMYADRFPVGDTLEFRLPPVQSVTSVAYVDTAGDSQVFASSNYNTDLTSTPARIELVDGSSWPATEDSPNAVTLTVTAGYGAASAVPTEAKLAITEWCKMVWGKCDGRRDIYDNMIGLLSWTGTGIAQ